MANIIKDIIEGTITASVDGQPDMNGRANAFLVKKASQWLKDASLKPAPKALFMCVWHEGEVCIMFADTNVGKSILAVMIAVMIAERQKVIYIDFELSEKQFEERYSENFTNHYQFPDNFIRAELNPDTADYEEAGYNNLEDYINGSIEQMVLETGAKIIIIDNITYLRSETERAKEALPLMKGLKAVKNKYGLSLLVLAHTPKRDLSKPITRNDLQGSKMLINFCDSAFAVGESSIGNSIRYLKQIKSRNAAIHYDADNVAVFQIVKPDNMVMFKSVQDVHSVSEHEHLKAKERLPKEDAIARVIEMNKQGKSQRAIAKKLGIGLGTVNNYLNIIK